MSPPEPYYSDELVTLHLGDCLTVLATMDDASVDAVVCDPPYGLEFMGREWDGADGFRRSLNEADAGRDSVFGRTSRTSPEYRTGKPSGARIRPPSEADQTSRRAHNATTSLVARNAPEAYVAGHLFQEWCEAWARECMRILKPGGHLLAFGGTRTWHRLACGIEDAGFEIRDSIDWLYGSGFPKNPACLKPAHEPIIMARRPSGRSDPLPGRHPVRVPPGPDRRRAGPHREGPRDGRGAAGAAALNGAGRRWTVTAAGTDGRSLRPRHDVTKSIPGVTSGGKHAL